MRRLSTLAVRPIMAVLCVLILTGSSMSWIDVLAQSRSETGEFLETDKTGHFKKCGQFWPSSGMFRTETNGFDYSAALTFRLTQEEKDALVCVDEYLEIEFQLLGFNVPNWWEGYTISTNLPGGTKDTAIGDTGNIAKPAITGIKSADLVVGTDYYAGISFNGLDFDKDDSDGARVSYVFQVSHWASPIKPSEGPYCIANNMALEWCIFKTVEVFLSHGYTNLAYGSKQSMPFVFNGNPNVEFPITVEPDGALPTIAAAPLPTIAGSTSCNDVGRPQQTGRLTASPQDPNTTTEVMLSVTITNAGCGTFAPTVLAIGGRDPGGNVTDPYQSRDFVLAPGESRTLEVPVVLSGSGTHEFFMAHQSGGWHRIPDTSGDSSSIYVTVTEAAAAATEEAGGSSVIEPNDTDEPDDSNANTGGSPTAQEVANGGLFAMGIGARTEGAEYPGHTFGARFVVTSEDGEYIGECMLEVNDTFPDVAWTNCKVDVPGDRISLVWEDLNSIPAGYAPVENPIAFDPTTYVTGPHNIGAVFQNVPIDATVPDAEVAPMDIGAGGPNGHEIGARFTVSTEDGTFLGSCTLVGSGNEPYPLSCQVDVPRYTTVVVTLDESSITPGYTPVQNPITFDTSSEPGAASHWGISFQLEAPGTTIIDGAPVDIAIYTTENGAPAYDACFELVGYSNIGCDENRDGKVTFADIPFGSYIVRQTADLGPGRYVNDFTIQISGQVNSEGYEPFPATIVSTSSSTNANTGGSSTAPSGSVDIALITRDPNGGKLLTDPCYVLVGYSIEGCDRNEDGQVTFADIPYGTYTVRQTQTPAGYPAINEFDITVAPMPIDGGGTPPGVPMGFIVRQAPEQNAPNTRNVSVILVNGRTFERVVSGACVEIVGASLVGCDEDLLDGQVDFLDVPAGGPYELRLTNVRAGYEPVTGFGSLNVSINAGAGNPANVIVFVLLTESSSTGGSTIQPIEASASNSSQMPVSTGGAVEATVYMTFRGCPEGFVPNTVDPYTACTIPLDAPDASRVGEWGDGSSLIPITGLQREYDGAYILPVTSQSGYSLHLTGLEPVLRDGFLIYGVDEQEGASYISMLANGESRKISIFYYYD
jgi:hypothetical protein